MVKKAAAAACAANEKHHEKKQQGFFRLDPYAIPDRIAFSHNDIHYTLDRTGVSVKMNMPQSGLPLSFALPARSFKGIAARCVETLTYGLVAAITVHFLYDLVIFLVVYIDMVIERAKGRR